MNNFFKNNKERLVRIVSELISKDTTNPPGDEYLAIPIVEKEFKKFNIPYSIYEKKEGRQNIIGKIGKGDISIMLAAHLDVVPAGDGWDTPPFEPVLKGDRLFGRGSLDDKGLMGSLLILAQYLKSIEDQLNIEILIAGVADEEIASKYGMTYLVDEKIVSPNYAIIPDNAGNLAEINIAEKGHLVLKAKSYGVQAHAMNPDQGVNAILNLSKFLIEVDNYTIDDPVDPLLKKSTINIGTIKGGSAHNSVPNYAESILDIRYLPGLKGEDIINSLNNIIEKITLKDNKIDIKLELELDSAPISIPKDNILVKTIKDVAETYHGKHVKITGTGGNTVCKDLVLSANCTAICFSAGDHKFYHQVNENVSVTELINYSEIMAQVILKLNEEITFL